MKKIALFSLLLCMCVNKIYANETCYAINLTHTMEENRCKEGGVYKDEGEACDPLNAPPGEGHCIKSNVPNQTSCAAKKCDGDSLLWTTKHVRKDEGRNVIRVGFTDTKTVSSEGVCYKRDFLESKCTNACGNCPSPKRCILNEIVIQNYGVNVNAFIGEEACVCVADDRQPQPEETCDVFTNVTCPDGKISGYKKIGTLKKADIFDQNNQNPISCTEFKNKMDNNEFLIVKTGSTQSKNLRDVVNEMMLQFCKKQNTGGGTVVDSATNAQNAHSRLQAFFNSKADVWKDAEGKFNTARLASDLTAGVVLGTVGGVVSGVVIKKKQVEKGFDALHCTVGGQTVADWGDEFIVGISK